MVMVVVERSFSEPVTLDLAETMRQGSWCLKQHGVRLLRSYLSSDRLRMICLFEAPDAEAVRRTQRQVPLPFERAWTARMIEAPAQG